MTIARIGHTVATVLTDSLTTTVSFVSTAGPLYVTLGSWPNAIVLNSMAYDGTALTLVSGSPNTQGNVGDRAQIWRLLAPNAGTHNLVLTWASVSGFVGVMSIWNTLGQDTGTPEGSAPWANSGSAATTTSSQTISGAAADDLVVWVACADSGASAWVPAATGGTAAEFLNQTTDGEDTSHASAAGAVTAVSTSWATSQGWSVAALLLKGEVGFVPPPQAAYVSEGTAAYTATSAATLAPGLPPGWAEDDIHVLLAARSDNTAMTALTGWTQLAAASGNNTAAQRQEVWWRRAVAGDTAPTVTFGSSTIVRGARIYGVRGAILTGDPFDTGGGAPTRSANAASATVAFTNLTTTEDGCLVLALGAYEDDPTATTLLSGFTAAGGGPSWSALGNDMMLFGQWKELPAAGTAGATSVTVSGGTFANSPNVGVLLALLPEPAPAVADVPFKIDRQLTQWRGY